MQLITQEIKIVEKVIENESGLFLVRFAVRNSGGNITWKLISCETLPSKCGAEIILLEAPILKEVFEFVKSIVQESVSQIRELKFLISQPTRAPSF